MAQQHHAGLFLQVQSRTGEWNSSLANPIVSTNTFSFRVPTVREF